MSIIENSAYGEAEIRSDLMSSDQVETQYMALTLVAMSQGAFVVVSGRNLTGTQFTDAQLEDILKIFDTEVDKNAGMAPMELRAVLATALEGSWSSLPAGINPLDLTIDAAAKIVFHLNVPGWSFSEPLMSLKSSSHPGEFTNLKRLKVPGIPDNGRMICVTDSCRNKGVYEYGLYIDIVQPGGGVTKIFIDPSIKNND
jgi:hypothetical protein